MTKLNIDLEPFVEMGFVKEEIEQEIINLKEQEKVETDLEAFILWKAKNRNRIAMMSRGGAYEGIFLNILEQESEEYGDKFKFFFVIDKGENKGELAFLTLTPEEFNVFIKKYPQQPELFEVWKFEVAEIRETRGGAKYIVCAKEEYEGERIPIIKRKGVIADTKRLRELLRTAANYPLDWQTSRPTEKVFYWNAIVYGKVTGDREFEVNGYPVFEYTISDLSTVSSFMPIKVVDWKNELDIVPGTEVFIFGGFYVQDPEDKYDPDKVIVGVTKKGTLTAVTVPLSLRE